MCYFNYAKLIFERGGRRERYIEREGESEREGVGGREFALLKSLSVNDYALK